MKTRSKKSYHIVRRVGNQGTRPPRELSQLGVEKCTTDSASSPNYTSDGHQERESPNSGPSEKEPPTKNQKEKRIRWSREDYSDVMYAYYKSLEKPSGNHTDNTYNIWRSRNPDIRPKMDGNKLANVRRDILKNNRLLDIELTQIKESVKAEIRNEEIRTNENLNIPQIQNLESLVDAEIFDEIPFDVLSDEEVDFSLDRRNNVHYDDIVGNMNTKRSRILSPERTTNNNASKSTKIEAI